MPRMTAADAAVAILRLEGVSNVFGLPGAAINPFYAAMRRDGGITHTLARHVEGASHMAEGYTRARAGNIGVCVGTSGPAGTDMVTGLYSASADSIPILCITGQAPVAKLHKEDFQAVNISAIAAPLTKMAMTVLEPAQVPGAFAQRVPQPVFDRVHALSPRTCASTARPRLTCDLTVPFETPMAAAISRSDRSSQYRRTIASRLRGARSARAASTSR